MAALYVKRLSIYCLLIALCAKSISGLKCWECENVNSQEECLEKGKLVECEVNQNTCQIELRHGGWGDYPLIEKTCKQLSACGSNHLQDSGEAAVFQIDNSQCNKKAPSSVCRCCCNTDGCNQDILYCDELGGRACSPVYTPKHGSMDCVGGMLPYSICTFSCDKGYALRGSNVSTCDVFSQRDFPAPTCVPITCHTLGSQHFGSYFCNAGIDLGSRCRFTCNAGYRLHGARTIKCLEDQDKDLKGLWSRPQPECKPLQCPKQFLLNGKMVCTNKNLVGSQCLFSCNSAVGYVLYPPASTDNQCKTTEQWTRRAPCCTLPCPPFAKMDFIVVLDSSSSVGAENFALMKNFVRSFLDDFTVRDDSTHFGIIRYNKVVDTKTQIFLDDYPNSIEGVLDAFEKIPYDGSGTRTGNALNYTAMTLLPRGNRPGIRDIVLLITDGASQDDVVVPSKILRDTGALVFVLPVLPPVGKLDLDEVEIIAGQSENVLTDALEKGFAALDEDFSRKISTLLCGKPCE